MNKYWRLEVSWAGFTAEERQQIAEEIKAGKWEGKLICETIKRISLDEKETPPES